MKSRVALPLSVLVVLAAGALLWVAARHGNPPAETPARADAARARPSGGNPAAGAAEQATERWRRGLALPAGFEREVELVAGLGELAEIDPAEAAKRLRALPDDDRQRIVAAVLLVASDEPRHALALAEAFLPTDPAGAREHGYRLVLSFARAGEYEAALEFVETQSRTRGESEDPNKWLKALYGAWAGRDPARAVARAARLPHQGVRDEALRVAAAVWARRDPAAATRFLASLPADAARTSALGETVMAWAANDPATASRWVAQTGWSPTDREAVLTAAAGAVP